MARLATIGTRQLAQHMKACPRSRAEQILASGAARIGATLQRSARVRSQMRVACTTLTTRARTRPKRWPNAHGGSQLLMMVSSCLSPQQEQRRSTPTPTDRTAGAPGFACQFRAGGVGSICPMSLADCFVHEMQDPEA